MLRLEWGFTHHPRERVALKDTIFQTNGILIDNTTAQHLPHECRTVHVLCEKDDAEEWDKDERCHTLLYVSLHAFHHVAQDSCDEVAVVYCIVVDDAVWNARRSDVIILLVVLLMARELWQKTLIWGRLCEHGYAFGVSCHDCGCPNIFRFHYTKSLISKTKTFRFSVFQSKARFSLSFPRQTHNQVSLIYLVYSAPAHTKLFISLFSLF